MTYFPDGLIMKGDKAICKICEKEKELSEMYDENGCIDCFVENGEPDICHRCGGMVGLECNCNGMLF